MARRWNFDLRQEYTHGPHDFRSSDVDDILSHAILLGDPALVAGILRQLREQGLDLPPGHEYVKYAISSRSPQVLRAVLEAGFPVRSGLVGLARGLGMERQARILEGRLRQPS